MNFRDYTLEYIISLSTKPVPCVCVCTEMITRVELESVKQILNIKILVVVFTLQAPVNKVARLWHIGNFHATI